MEFKDFNLSEPLMRAIEAQGFQRPTPVQVEAIPAAVAGRDVLGSAQTGTGKTVAFLLPSLQHLLQGKSPKHPRMLVLAPTRELALQIAEEARDLARFTHLRVLAVYGGSSINKQRDQFRKGVDIVVATPGRLMDHMRRRNLRLQDLEILVLDEADRMLDMGFLPDIETIVREVPQRRQTMLFSATIPQPIVSLSRRFLEDPVRVELNTDTPPETIEQTLYPVPKHLKTKLLIHLLQDETVDSGLIFTRTKQTADVLARKLRETGLTPAVIHGDFSQQKRLSALNRFRKGNARLLIATNVAARGLDIEDISHVVNYDVPDEAENYIHRIGRTARLHAEGAAWTLVTPEDEPLIASIEYLLDTQIERRTLADFDYDVPAPDWAKPSAETILRRVSKQQSNIDRWKTLTR